MSNVRHIEIPKEKLQPRSNAKPSLFAPSNNYSFLDCMIELYHATLDASDWKPVTLPEPVASYARLTYEHCNQDPSKVKVGGVMKQRILPQDGDFIIHLVTGGKDSTAAVLRDMGKYSRTELLHVIGVNKIYPTEHQIVQKLYPKYTPSCQLTNLKVNLPRVTNASESPFKLMYIIAQAVEVYDCIPASITVGGSAGIADVSEVEVYGDSGRALRAYIDCFNAVHESVLVYTPYLRDQVEAYELTRGIPASEMCSCFSQLRFKPMQRSMALEKWSVKVDGRTLIAGTTKEGKSIFSTGVDLKSLSISDLINVDEVVEDDYRCIGGCFKCRERALVNTAHFGYHYHPDYLRKSREGLIGWMDKSPNNNGVKLERYFTECLLIPMSEIPRKYHKYIAGGAVRPDGWKPPKEKPNS